MTILRSNSFPSSLEQKFKTGLQLPELCSTIVRTLCNGNLIWDTDRLINFSLFCNLLIIQMNIPPPILYTSLKYFQSILLNSTNEYDIIDLSNVGHEYSLLTISLSLAYKYLDDNPPLLKQWSYVSMIPTETLVTLEAHILNKLGYSLSIPVDELNDWTEQCNAIYEMSLVSLDCLDLFDLHNTKHRLGYNTLLPVVLDDYYILPASDPMFSLQPQEYLFGAIPDETAIPIDQLWYLTPTSIQL